MDGPQGFLARAGLRFKGLGFQAPFASELSGRSAMNY